jgi:hypothetical protein
MGRSSETAHGTRTSPHLSALLGTAIWSGGRQQRMTETPPCSRQGSRGCIQRDTQCRLSFRSEAHKGLMYMQALHASGSKKSVFFSKFRAV